MDNPKAKSLAKALSLITISEYERTYTGVSLYHSIVYTPNQCAVSHKDNRIDEGN